MVKIENLTFGYKKNKPVLENVNLNLRKGYIHGLLGKNGIGKTTLLKLISGLLFPDNGEIKVGEFVPSQRKVAFLYDTFFLSEDLYESRLTIEKFCKVNSVFYPKFSASDFENFLKDFDIEDTKQRLDKLSYGTRKKVLIAFGLACHCKLMLLDEPTNGLDLESISWLEDFLLDFENVVIVVSHDRHFLNTVCTVICDIDYGKITQFAGNYDFWYQMSQILQKQAKDQKRKNEEKAKDLKEFIQRFASNAAKSRQATSRKKILEKLELDDLPVTSRKFPFVQFKPDREIGNNVLECRKLNSKDEDGVQLLNDFSLIVNRTDKIAFVGVEHNTVSSLFDIISGEKKAESGEYFWGQTTSCSYLARDNNQFFNNDYNITEWLKQFSKEQDDAYVRGFLGRMLFSGDESLKKVKILSGGEKVRCMLSKLMLAGSNILIMDDPTNHLDLEAIESLNRALVDFPGVILFTSHDHEFISTIANRIVEITPKGVIDRMMPFDDYMADDQIRAMREEYYKDSDRKIKF